LKFKRHIRIEYAFDRLNIAPLIDVIFLLLIFFMLTSSFTFQSGITVKLPKTVTSDVIKQENFIVTITGENIIYLNNKIITYKELKKELGKSANQKIPILIKADRRASVGRIVDIWDLCRNLGIERINIATDQKRN